MTAHLKRRVVQSRDRLCENLGRRFLTFPLAFAQIAKYQGHLPGREAVVFLTAAPEGQAMITEIEARVVLGIAGLAGE